MRVLISGGKRTNDIVEKISKKFEASGDEFVTVEYVDNIDKIFATGDYFDKAIILDKSITHDSTIEDENSLRGLVNSFAYSMAARAKKCTYVFLISDEDLANAVHEELLPIIDECAIIKGSNKYTIPFFVSVIITDISQLPENILYKAPMIVPEEAVEEETDEQVNTLDDLDVNTREPLDELSNINETLVDLGNNEYKDEFSDYDSELTLPEDLDFDDTQDSFEGNTDSFEGNTDSFEGFNGTESANFGGNTDNFGEETDAFNNFDEFNENESETADTFESFGGNTDNFGGFNNTSTLESGLTDETPAENFGATEENDNTGFDFENMGFGGDSFEQGAEQTEEVTEQTDFNWQGDTESANSSEDLGFDMNNYESSENTADTSSFTDSVIDFENITPIKQSDDLPEYGGNHTTENIESSEAKESENMFNLEGFDYTDEQDNVNTEIPTEYVPEEPNLLDKQQQLQHVDIIKHNNSEDNMGTNNMFDSQDYINDDNNFGTDANAFVDDYNDNSDVGGAFDASDYNTEDEEEIPPVQSLDRFNPNDYTQNTETEQVNSFENMQQTEQNNMTQGYAPNNMPMQQPMGQAPKKKGLFGKLFKGGAATGAGMTAGANMMNNNNFVNQPQGQMQQPTQNMQGSFNNQMAPQNVKANKNMINPDKIKDEIRPFANRGNSIVVTGCGGCGTSTMAYNIANVINQLGYTVLLVDMDTEGRTQSYITRSNYESIDPEGANLMSAVNSSNGINTHIGVVKRGFHLLTMGLASDVAPVNELLHKEKISRFVNLAKANHNFVIYDIPFDSAVGFLSDITYMSDNIVLIIEASNWGVTKSMLSMTNIASDDMQEIMFTRSQLLFNRQRNLRSVFGKKIKSCADITKAMDQKVLELCGEEPEFHFSDLHIAGVIDDDIDFESGWYGDVQYSDMKKGKDIFLRIVERILLGK